MFATFCKQIIISICLLVFLTYITNAQKAYEPEFGDPFYEPWRWICFNELTGKGVQCIAETPEGNIVFGLDKGAIEYDGINWIEHNVNNGFVDDAVNKLVLTEDNFFYAGTENGLYCLENGIWKKIFPIKQFESRNEFQNVRFLSKMNGGGVVASIGNAKNSILLFCTNGNYEILASEKTLNTFNNPAMVKMHEVPDDLCINNVFYVESIFQDKQNRFWVWESTGNDVGKVFYFEKDSDKIIYSSEFTSKDGLVKGKGTLFSQDKDDNIWLINSTFYKGLSIFNGSRWSNVKLPGENSYLSVKKVDDVMWVGGFGVLFASRDGEWEIYKKPATPIPASKIFVYNDSRGYLWVAGIKGEVVRIDYSGVRWASYKKLNYHCEDNNSNQWFIDVKGKVVVKKDNQWYSFDVSDGLPDAVVRIFCTKEGLICATGSYEQKACISYFNGFTWKRQVFPELSWGIDYRAVFEDKDNNLWIGSSVNFTEFEGHLGGVIKIQNPGKENQKHTHYEANIGIKMGECYGFGQTADGSIWLSGSHLVKHENGEWDGYTAVEPLNQPINSMTSSPEGTLWVGSRRFGVFRFENGKWTEYNTNNGLSDNNVVSILPISDNDVWLATNSGFSRYDGQSWMTDLFHENLTLSQEEGEIKNRKNGTIWINRASRAWNRRAIHNNVVEEDDIEYYSSIIYNANSLAPETKIVVYSNEVSPAGNTYIEWSGQDMWSETPVSKLQYSYRLNDGNWTNFDRKTNVTLLKLRNGDYRFEVRSRDVDLNVDLTPAFVNFKVLPPVWKQAWFIGLIAAFLFVIFIYQYITFINKKKLEKLNLELIRHGEEIETKNSILQEQKEQIIRQTLNEKELHQSKLRFFTNISHEFRTPLTLVNGIIDNLTEKSLSENPAYCREQLQIAKKNSNKLLHFINQLMDFRKLDNQSVKLGVSEVGIVDFVKEICKSFQVIARKYHISLNCNCSEPEFYGWIDTDLFDKIIVNLISNAIKFTPEKGNVNISIRKVIFNGESNLELVVEDNGIGIPGEKIQKIFEPFYQTNSAVLSGSKGTGIGLSLVYNFVHLHKGNIEVYSSTDPQIKQKRNYSTRFVIKCPIDKSSYSIDEIVDSPCLPAAEQVTIVIEKPDLSLIKEIATPDYQKKGNIQQLLIVEDNDDLRHFMADLLKSHFNVVEARNGAEGFNQAISVLPDLVISDVMMPEVSGIELCKNLKNDIRTSHIPVILLTALTTDENKIDGYVTGADGYITKPFNYEILFAQINNLLATREKLRKKYKSEAIINPNLEEVVSMDTVFLQKLKNVLEENYSDSEFNVDELCRKVGISNRHLLHKLKNLIDISPVEYIKIFRLKKAAHLLESSKGTVSEIAYETGFSDVSYFGKCFSKQFHMSPSEFVKANSESNPKD